MGMTEAGDRMNRPPAPPDEDDMCEWTDWNGVECDRLADQEQGEGLCQMHYGTVLEEQAAETAVKAAKEDETWQ